MCIAHFQNCNIIIEHHSKYIKENVPAAAEIAEPKRHIGLTYKKGIGRGLNIDGELPSVPKDSFKKGVYY